VTQLNESQLYALIQSVQITDPVLKDLLREFVKRQEVVFDKLFDPIPSVPPQVDAPIPVKVADVLIFNYELIKLGIRLTWEQPSLNAILYEIRVGNSWEDSTRVIVTSTLQAIVPGMATDATHKFWIKAQSLTGEQSENAKELDVLIPAISTPSLTGSVIDNFAMVSWDPCISAFQLDYYEVYKDGNFVGRTYTTFLTIPELESGTYNYCVTAVDIYLNKSQPGCKSFVVSQPPDYDLAALETDDLNGWRIRVHRDAIKPSLFAVLNIEETWGEYAANGWATMQDEIDSGYPYWLQPTVMTGEYGTEFDYGTVYNDLIVSVDWNQVQIVPLVTVQCFIQTSIDGISWTDEIETQSIFVVALRYARIRLLFTSKNAGKALLELFNLRTRLDVKLVIDAGTVLALAADALGTPAYFRIPFKDVNSITVSAESVNNYTATYSFVDIPSPTGFEVYAWGMGAGGTVERKDCPVSWKARGVT